MNYAIRAKHIKVNGPLVRGQYADGSMALMIGQAPLGEKLSINLIDYGMTPPEGHIFVPDYSQHEGLPEAVAVAGIAAPIRVVKFGPFDATAMLMVVTATDIQEMT